MKTVLTLLFVVILGVAAIANTGENHVKVKLVKVDLVLDGSTNSADTNKKIETATNQEVARLYRRKNTLVKKALSFRTKKNKAKLA